MAKKWQDLREESVQERTVKTTITPFKPKNAKQTILCKEIETNILTFAIGAAGSGKSFVALAVASQMLKEGRINKILLTRPLVECGGEKIGHLPGSVSEKIDPMLKPCLDLLRNFWEPRELGELRKEGIIEIMPLAHMRGLTYNNAVMILEEGQNTNKTQLKMFLTRPGENCRVIICADTEQSDLDQFREPPLVDVMYRLRYINGVGVVRFEPEDVVRSAFVREVLLALK